MPQPNDSEDNFDENAPLVMSDGPVNPSDDSASSGAPDDSSNPPVVLSMPASSNATEPCVAPWIKQGLNQFWSDKKFDIADALLFGICTSLVVLSVSTPGGFNDAQGILPLTLSGLGWNSMSLAVAIKNFPMLWRAARNSVLHPNIKTSLAIMFAMVNFIVLPVLTAWGYYTALRDFAQSDNAKGNILSSSNSFGDPRAIQAMNFSFGLSMLSFGWLQLYSAYRAFQKKNPGALCDDRRKKHGMPDSPHQTSYVEDFEDVTKKERITNQYKLLALITSNTLIYDRNDQSKMASEIVMIDFLRQKQIHLLLVNALGVLGNAAGTAAAFLAGLSDCANTEAKAKQLLIPATALYSLAAVIKAGSLIYLLYLYISSQKRMAQHEGAYNETFLREQFNLPVGKQIELTLTVSDKIEHFFSKNDRKLISLIWQKSDGTQIEKMLSHPSLQWSPTNH